MAPTAWQPSVGIERPGAHCRGTGLKPPGQRMSASQAHRVTQEFQKISDQISRKSITVGCARCIIIIIVGLVFISSVVWITDIDIHHRETPTYTEERGEKDTDLHWGERGKRHWLTLRRKRKKTPTYKEGRGYNDPDLRWDEGSERLQFTLRVRKALI